MPKWKSYYDSDRKYKKEWEKKYSWLKKAPDNSEDALCTLCHCTIKSKLYNFAQHELSSKHKSKVSGVNQNTLQSFVKVTKNNNNTDIKQAEIKLAVAVTCHCSVMAVDHLTDVIKHHGKGSILADINLHRTKCSQIIQNVVSPALAEDLKEDLKSKKFVLLIDESTDVAIQKHLCIVVRFFSENVGIKTAYLGLLPVSLATAQSLFDELKFLLSEYDMKFENCIGFASDGAATMVGCKNSVWTRINEIAPNCVQMKCVCHSLALCIQHAFEKLPSSLGFLITEIPLWFSNSNLRRENYKAVFETLNPESETEYKYQAPLPFQKASKTRWLVKGKVMFNILLNWQELKAYFATSENTGRTDTKFKARLLKEMLYDKVNYLYFVFATPIVKDFEAVNSMFQSTNMDPHKLSNELELLRKTLYYRIYNNDDTEKGIENIDFGAKFQQEVNSHLNEFKERQQVKEEESKILEVKRRCHIFIVEAIDQVRSRLSNAAEAFKNLSLLNPSTVLNQTTKCDFSDLPMLHLAKNNSDEIEQQYRKITVTDWKLENVFENNEIPDDTTKFWLGVYQHENFKELAAYALNCLVTPASNAIVERIFSLVTAIKAKPRNRMQIKLLDAIVRIRAHLFENSICCKDMHITDKMIKKLKSDILYSYAGETVASTSHSQQTARSTQEEEEFDITMFL